MASLTRKEIKAQAVLCGIEDQYQDVALDALCKRDAMTFVLLVWSFLPLSSVYWNHELLKSLDIFETALFVAWSVPDLNNYAIPLSQLNLLLRLADPRRLREAGDPIPGPGPFTLYRGVAGYGRARRERGFSWTLSLRVAAWFASRLVPTLPDPVVLRAVVPMRSVLAYTNARNEDEFLVRLPRSIVPDRLSLDAGALADIRAAYTEKKEKGHAAKPRGKLERQAITPTSQKKDGAA